MKTTITKYQPDIIITNSGGAMFMGEHQILMNADETIEVARMAPEANVVAVHMEALDHCTVTRSAMALKVKESGVNVYIPQDGETIAW